MSFISSQCRKHNAVNPLAVTFGQPLYVKACAIVLSININIIVRLGRFHQLMSFFGSIECAVEGSGQQNAFETVYAPTSVGCILQARPIQGQSVVIFGILSFNVNVALEVLGKLKWQREILL